MTSEKDINKCSDKKKKKRDISFGGESYSVLKEIFDEGVDAIKIHLRYYKGIGKGEAEGMDGRKVKCFGRMLKILVVGE